MSQEKQREIYLDFKGAIDILRSRGEKINIKETAKKIGYSEVGMMNVRRKAPKQIEMLYNYLKDNNLTFEELVKER